MRSIKNIKTQKPTVFTVFATFGFMGEPLIFSINKKNNRPPSSAGKGTRFITARLIEIRAMKDNR